MKEIVIQIDEDKMLITNVEGIENINPLNAVKFLLSVALNTLSHIKLKKESKIIKPKVGIIK